MADFDLIFIYTTIYMVLDTHTAVADKLKILDNLNGELPHALQ